MAGIASVIARSRKSGALVLRMLARFLRRPSLDPIATQAPVPRLILAIWLLIFSFAATAIFALLALPLLVSSDASPGDGLRDVFGGSALSIIVAVIILGPLVEEMIFRGWLTGGWRALAGSALFLAIFFGGSWLLTAFAPRMSGHVAHVGLAAAGLLGFAAIRERNESAAPAWFRRAFPLVFWAQGLLFGGLHYANVESASALLPLLMSIPLVLCGWMWGYARIGLGFGAAWMLHMAYNLPSALGAMVIMAITPSG